jgi:hypothetical protein
LGNQSSSPEEADKIRDLVNGICIIARDPAVTSFADGSYVVSWATRTEGDADILARFVTATGQMSVTYPIFDEGSGPAADDSLFPDLATLSNGNFVAVWQDEFNGSTTDYDVMYHIMTRGGGSIWGPDTVSGAGSGGAETDPDVAGLTGGGFVVVWTDADSSNNVTDIRATIYTNGANVTRSNILVNTTTTGAQNEPSVVGLLDGGFLVTWDDDHFNFIRGQRFDAAGNRVGSEFNVAVGPLEAPTMTRLLDGRIAFAMDDNSSGDFDVATSMWNPRGTVATLDDVLWRHTDGTLSTADRELGLVSNGWSVVGNGDTDGDTDADIVWQNLSSGGVVLWEMQNGQYLINHNLPSVGTSWSIVGTGDFDDDGDDDILWRNGDGRVLTWELEDNGLVRTHSLPSASSAWRIAGIGDLDGDGDDDLIWHHSGGQVVTWEMQNDGLRTTHSVAQASGGWNIQGTGDFDRDGDDDLVWRNAEGRVTTWEMQGNLLVVNHNIESGGNSWRIHGVHDFDSDGDSDILWRNDNGHGADVGDERFRLRPHPQLRRGRPRLAAQGRRRV